MASTPLTVLHLCPHPDDEAIAVPATLMALRDAGHRVVNFACGLGRPADHARRRAELEEAARRSRFELRVHDPPLAISAGDDLPLAQARLTRAVEQLLDEEQVSLVVSPSPHDRHPGHELVGRAARDVLAARGRSAPRWWLWGLWADLPLPTLVTPFGEERLAEVLRTLDAYTGENARNDYPAMVAARGTVNRVLGAERAFGFGRPGIDADPYAELLTEVVRREGGWHAAAPRLLDERDPLASPGPYSAIDWWIAEPSFTERLEAARPPARPR